MFVFLIAFDIYGAKAVDFLNNNFKVVSDQTHQNVLILLEYVPVKLLCVKILSLFFPNKMFAF